jgi:hypothetical protein
VVLAGQATLSEESWSPSPSPAAPVGAAGEEDEGEGDNEQVGVSVDVVGQSGVVYVVDNQVGDRKISGG